MAHQFCSSQPSSLLSTLSTTWPFFLELFLPFSACYSTLSSDIDSKVIVWYEYMYVGEELLILDTLGTA